MLTIQSIAAFTVPVSDKTIWIVLELKFEGRPSGWGEATLSGAEEAVLAEIGHANTLLAGKNAGRPPKRCSLARWPTPRCRHGRDPRGRAGILRRAGPRSGISLAALLGGPERRSVPVYANINRGIPDRTPQGFAARAKRGR